MIVKICVMLILLVHAAGGLMCYFCADTSKERGRNQCQTWHKTMKYYRKRFEQLGSFNADKYIKNCTAYGDPDKPKYCMIAHFDELDHRRSFIRDCSDGTSFITDDTDKYFERKNIRPDNQTHCQQSLSNASLVCVTLCGPSQLGSGDFCNGPVLVSLASSILPFLFLFISSLFVHVV